MAAVKSPYKKEYTCFSERTQNILLFELFIVSPIYLECHISRNPGGYSLSSPTPPSNRDFRLNPAACPLAYTSIGVYACSNSPDVAGLALNSPGVRHFDLLVFKGQRKIDG